MTEAPEFGADFVDPFRRSLEQGVVFGVQQSTNTLHHLEEPAESSLHVVEPRAS